MDTLKLHGDASNLQVPANERLDMRKELMQAYTPTNSELPHMGDVAQLAGALLNEYQDRGMWKADSYGSGAWNGQAILRNHSQKPGEAKTIFLDERGTFGSTPGGYRRRPSQFGPEHLRLMVEHVPLINSIILRRCRTVSRFLCPEEPDKEIGFMVRRRDLRPGQRVKRGEEESVLERFLMSSGWEENPIERRRLNRDTLEQFVKKAVRDLLTLDTWAVELVPSQNRKMLHGYHAIDSGTIYLASEQGYQGDSAVTAIQIVNGMPVTTYTDDELMFLSQNPRTDVVHYGYGYAPTEMIVKIVTGYLNAITYNLKGFDSNAIPKGLLTLFGSFDEKELNAFKRQWEGLVKGVNNAWALPVMVSDSKDTSAKYEKLGSDFSEMYFAKWMTFLTSIVCSVYGMDPSEVYSEGFHAGRSSLSGSDMAERLADARDTGLEPLMNTIHGGISDHILARVSPDYVMRFFGLHPYDQEWRHKQEEACKRVDEYREELGLDPFGGIVGQAPINPSLQTLYQQEMQAQMQPQGAGPEQPRNDEEVPEPQVEESEDREPLKKQETPAVEESGDREEEQPGAVNQPETASRDRGWDSSTMLRKSRAYGRDVVVMG